MLLLFISVDLTVRAAYIQCGILLVMVRKKVIAMMKFEKRGSPNIPPVEDFYYFDPHEPVGT